MDWLWRSKAELAEAVYWSVADLLNLEVDLLFFDTTSTYFEIEQADAPTGAPGGAPATTGFRTYGHSKDHRPDLPQVVIGMAVTRTGIPIRVWCWPGNTNDSALIRQVKDDLRAWKLTRVVWVADRGFSSAENRRYLQRAGGHYIIGEQLRGKSAEAQAALARAGPLPDVVAGNLRVKEVVIDDATMRDRFVVCHNPEEADRDKSVRDQLLAQLGDAIAGSDQLNRPRAKLAGELQGHPGAQPVPAHHPRRAATRRPTSRRGRGPPRRQVPAPHLGPDAVRRRRRPGLQAAPRGRTGLAGHEVHPRPAPRLPPRADASVPTSCGAGWPCSSSASPRPRQDTWRNLRHQLDRLHLGTFTGTSAPSAAGPPPSPNRPPSCAPSSSPNHPSSPSYTPSLSPPPADPSAHVP